MRRLAKARKVRADRRRWERGGVCRVAHGTFRLPVGSQQQELTRLLGPLPDLWRECSSMPLPLTTHS